METFAFGINAQLGGSGALTENTGIDLIKQDGWLLLPQLIDHEFIDRLIKDLGSAYEIQRPIQIRNGIGKDTNGTLHHLPSMGGTFLEFLDRAYCAGLLDSFFSGPYVLNSFGGVLNLPNDVAYVGRVHRDLRTFSGDLNLMAQLLVMLDDFTEENGATCFLTGSHRCPQRPDDKEFFAACTPALGNAGSVVFFNSNLWHAAGLNRTNQPRRALTLIFTRPFIKPQFDYPRAIGYEAAGSLSDRLKQVLGYNARIPATLDEWYQPPDSRMYQPGQG
jgi:Phytanoyl-CoA dioxygenase (PhyH)